MRNSEILKAMECHLRGDTCRDCPYDDISISLCNDELMRDSCALLHKTLPHVLRYEELMDMSDVGIACFWCEAKIENGVGPYLSRWLHPFIYTEQKIMCDVFGNTTYVQLMKEDYGKLWRAWSSRPTDEERNAIEWNH